MTVSRPSDGTLVVEADDNRFAVLFLAIFVALAVLAIVVYVRDPLAVATERFQGSVGGATMGLVAFLITFERSEFVFDHRRREVRWRRRRALRAHAGTIPFAAITDVAARQPLGDEGVSSRRVVLVTVQGEIPLSAAYRTDANDACLRLADELRRFVRAPDVR